MTRSLRDQFSTMRFLHTVLAAPLLFYGGVAFLIAHPSTNPPIVNSRMDSQRRRLGKEVTAR